MIINSKYNIEIFELTPFIITSDNWKSVIPCKYGYKWFKDQGFWISIEHKSTEILITGSYARPYICYYIDKITNKYYLSNSMKLLVETLSKDNITLTKLVDYNTYDEFIHQVNYNSDNIFNSIFKEIKYVPIDKDIVCNDSIRLINSNKHYFNIDFVNATKLINDWYKDYVDLINSLPKNSYYMQLSAGQDTRLILGMIDNYSGLNIYSNYKSEVEFKLVTNLLSKLKLLPIININKYNLMYENDKCNKINVYTKYNTDEVDNTNRYRSSIICFTGRFSEYNKDSVSRLNNLNIINSFSIYRFCDELDLALNNNIIKISPFIDSRLLTIYYKYSGQLHSYIYSLYKKYLKLILLPFYNSGKKYIYKYSGV